MSPSGTPQWIKHGAMWQASWQLTQPAATSIATAFSMPPTTPCGKIIGATRPITEPGKIISVSLSPVVQKQTMSQNPPPCCWPSWPWRMHRFECGTGDVVLDCLRSIEDTSQVPCSPIGGCGQDVHGILTSVKSKVILGSYWQLTIQHCLFASSGTANLIPLTTSGSFSPQLPFGRGKFGSIRLSFFYWGHPNVRVGNVFLFGNRP